MKKLKNATFRLWKGLHKAAHKNLPTIARRIERAYGKGATALGVGSEPVVAKEVIVSLTSFPLRVGKLHHVVSSLLDQTVRPRKVVLYLSLCEFPDRAVPKALVRLQGHRFEIRFVSENLRSHNKLQFALADFVGSWIATTDDDRLYPADWLEFLLKGAAESPGTIICSRGRRMLEAHGRFLPFKDWPLYKSPRPSFLVYPVGSWGVLYPPGSLHSITGDRELIRSLAPFDDDTWFKAMSLLQNVPCRTSRGRGSGPPIRFKQDLRLWDRNQHGTLIDEALDKVFGHFGLTAETVLAKEATLRCGSGDP